MRNATRWATPLKNVLSGFFKKCHIDQESSNDDDRPIAATMCASDGNGIENKADDTVTGNRGHGVAAEDKTSLIPIMMSPKSNTSFPDDNTSHKRHIKSRNNI